VSASKLQEPSFTNSTGPSVV